MSLSCAQCVCASVFFIFYSVLSIVVNERRQSRGKTKIMNRNRCGPTVLYAAFVTDCSFAHFILFYVWMWTLKI